MYRPFLTLVKIGVLAFALTGFSQTVETAALNRLEGSGVSDGEIISLTNALRSELSRTGEFSMMERSQIEDILREQGFQASGACSDESCIIEMGQLLAVKYMFFGYIGKVGQTFTVTVRQIDVGTGKVVSDVMKNYRGEVDNLLLQVMPAIAREIAGVGEATASRRERAPRERDEKTEKKRWPVILAGVAVAGAIPVIILSGNNDNENDNNDDLTGVEIRWLD